MRLTTIAKGVGAAALCLAAAGGAFALRDLRPLLSPDRTAERQSLGATTRSLVYKVPDEGVLRFALSRPTTLVRILSQPNIGARSWASQSAWVYGYCATMRDADGGIVFQRDIYSRALHPSRLRPFKRPVRFRRGSQGGIALLDEAVLESDAPASVVELTALDADPGVVDLDARVFERLPFIGSTALSAYLRRSPEEQAQLSRSDAFPPELVSDAERAALMSNRWRVIGPVGIPGRDYRVDVVYERPYEAEEARP